MKKKKILKFEFLNKNHPPTCYIKYKRIGFAPFNESTMANKLLFTNLE